MDFNKILPDNFFNLFQSKNRNLYIESLIRVYKRYETGSILGMPKDEARDIVEELLEEDGETIEDLYDEDDQDEEIQAEADSVWPYKPRRSPAYPPEY